MNDRNKSRGWGRPYRKQITEPKKSLKKKILIISERQEKVTFTKLLGIYLEKLPSKKNKNSDSKKVKKGGYRIKLNISPKKEKQIRNRSENKIRKPI